MNYASGLIKRATRADMQREEKNVAAKGAEPLNGLRWGYRQRGNE